MLKNESCRVLTVVEQSETHEKQTKEIAELKEEVKSLRNELDMYKMQNMRLYTINKAVDRLKRLSYGYIKWLEDNGVEV